MCSDINYGYSGPRSWTHLQSADSRLAVMVLRGRRIAWSGGVKSQNCQVAVVASVCQSYDCQCRCTSGEGLTKTRFTSTKACRINIHPATSSSPSNFMSMSSRDTLIEGGGLLCQYLSPPEVVRGEEHLEAFTLLLGPLLTQLGLQA